MSTPSAAHVSVLLAESVEALAIRPDGCYLDATFGRGGHSRAILSRLGEKGRLFALDRDPQAAEVASRIDDARFRFAKAPFSMLGRGNGHDHIGFVAHEFAGDLPGRGWAALRALVGELQVLALFPARCLQLVFNAFAHGVENQVINNGRNAYLFDGLCVRNRRQHGGRGHACAGDAAFEKVAFFHDQDTFGRERIKKLKNSGRCPVMNAAGGRLLVANSGSGLAGVAWFACKASAQAQTGSGWLPVLPSRAILVFNPAHSQHAGYPPAILQPACCQHAQGAGRQGFAVRKGKDDGCARTYESPV